MAGLFWYWMVDTKVSAEFRAEGYEGPIYAQERVDSIQYYIDSPWAEDHEEEVGTIAAAVQKHVNVPVWIEDYPLSILGEPTQARLVAGDERPQKATA